MIDPSAESLSLRYSVPPMLVNTILDLVGDHRFTELLIRLIDRQRSKVASSLSNDGATITVLEELKLQHDLLLDLICSNQRARLLAGEITPPPREVDTI